MLEKIWPTLIVISALILLGGFLLTISWGFWLIGLLIVVVAVIYGFAFIKIEEKVFGDAFLNGYLCIYCGHWKKGPTQKCAACGNAASDLTENAKSRYLSIEHRSGDELDAIANQIKEGRHFEFNRDELEVIKSELESQIGSASSAGGFGILVRVVGFICGIVLLAWFFMTMKAT